MGTRMRQAELERLWQKRAGSAVRSGTGPADPGRLIQLGEDEHALLITMHHIVSDGWSMGVLIEELSALYGAFRAGAKPIRCRSWRSSTPTMRCGSGSGWKGRSCSGRRSTGRRRLAGAPALLELPADHARPAQQDYARSAVPAGVG